MGQRIRAEVDIPLLHDANLNDQGIDARGVHIRNGNMYGSSRDIGKILGALPVLTEEGGRVNRVGFSRSWTEGTFNKFGFFFEYSQDLVNFDSDPQIVSRMYEKAMTAAEQVTEDALQSDLLNGAGTVIYSGNAISDETMDHNAIISYQAIRRLSRALDDNQTPRETKYIFGSTNLDTRTATTYRTLFVGAEVLAILEQMKDHFGNPAFIHAHQYGAGISKLMEDEVGIIDKFRVVYVEGMLGWNGAGADVDPQYGLASEGGKYNIYPALCIGTDAFTCISFDGSNGVNNKFQIHHQKPNQSYSLLDPYGEIGFVSIKWWYGIMFKRPERIGVIKTVAPM
jgi:N4 gp56-like protein